MAPPSAPHAPPRDLERAATYVSIPAGPPFDQPAVRFRRLLASIIFAFFLSLSIVFLIIKNRETDAPPMLSYGRGATQARPVVAPPSRGPAQGVSEKVFLEVGGRNLTSGWTNVMLTWQRTAFHFQPEKYWMNGNCIVFIGGPGTPNAGWIHAAVNGLIRLVWRPRSLQRLIILCVDR